MSDVAWLEDHRGKILRYATHLLRDASEAEDLLQEVWLRAMRNVDTVREDNAKVTWLYRITTHAALDHLRSRKRRLPLDLTTEPDEVVTDENSLPSLVTTLERREMSACVQDFVQRLPDNYRSVLFLTEFEGLSGDEVAETLGITLATAKVRLHRARQQLKDALHAGCCLYRDERGVLICTRR